MSICKSTKGLSLLLLLLLGAGIHAAENTVRVVTVHWPPYTDEYAKMGGFVSEILAAAFKEVGYDIEISFIPWSRGLKDTKSGRFDALYPAYFSEERSIEFVVSQAVAEGELGFFTRSEHEIQYQRLEDLKSYKIGVVRGYVNTKDFDNAEYLTKSQANSDEQNLRKLLKGRVDLAVADRLTGSSLINTKIPEAKGKLKYIQPPLQIKELFVLFSKSKTANPKLAAAFNRGLTIIKNSGAYASIVAKYTN